MLEPAGGIGRETANLPIQADCLAPESGHPIFHAALDGCTEFELTHWTGQQHATTYVISMFAGEGGHAH